jgi:hypothetical protein
MTDKNITIQPEEKQEVKKKAGPEEGTTAPGPYHNSKVRGMNLWIK